MASRNVNYELTAGEEPFLKESQIEEAFIRKLLSLKYTHRPDIHSLDALEANFREKFERLNAVTLSDSEFSRLLDQITTPDVYKSAELLRGINSFERDDGTPLNFSLVNIKDWCKNDYEIVSQLRINTRSSFHRYDVILLVNGIPCVQIELKTLQISPRRAMQQIVDYKGDPGNGYTNTLLSFMQLFIVSNRTNTYYFVNNNSRHFAFDAKENFLPVYQYADRDNNKITHLDRFAEAFLPKCTLGHMISRCMVLVANEQKLLMMRPYQIYAVKDIVECIHDNSGNGYIWHTTGSGKTLISFKASTLLKDRPEIDKCLFVIDRKDLDRQTREEFNKFQENCVEENTHTLVRRLRSDDKADKVIVTTIQKLGLALDENSKRNRGRKERKQATYKELLAPLAEKRLAIIFDECHRSQFGENHKAIKDFFPNSQLFGFTGTPIFEENSTVKQRDGDEASFRTTADIFQQELHKYTITHAIADDNVLRFHVDYFKPEGEKDKAPPKPGEAMSKKAVIDQLGEAVKHLDEFMSSQGLTCAPEDVPKLKGEKAKAQFIKTFKEVQRLKTQLDQYTDLDSEQKAAIEATLPTDTHRAFKGVYIDTARKLKQQRDTSDPGDVSPEVDELDFEFVLFASATIDYDYIMELVAKADGIAPGKQKMTREQLVSLIASDTNFADQRELLEKYIRQLDLGQGRSKDEILDGYEAFKDAEESKELQSIAQTHGLAPEALSDFTEEILRRLVFDGEHLTDLMAPLELGWKDRRNRELALMKDLVPLLKQRSHNQTISGLSGYESER